MCTKFYTRPTQFFDYFFTILYPSLEDSKNCCVVGLVISLGVGTYNGIICPNGALYPPPQIDKKALSKKTLNPINPNCGHIKLFCGHICFPKGTYPLNLWTYKFVLWTYLLPQGTYPLNLWTYKFRVWTYLCPLETYLSICIIWDITLKAPLWKPIGYHMGQMARESFPYGPYRGACIFP